MPRRRLTMSDANKMHLFSCVLRFLLTKNVQTAKRATISQITGPTIVSDEPSSGNLPFSDKNAMTVKCKNVVVAGEEIRAVEKETAGRVARSALPA